MILGTLLSWLHNELFKRHAKTHLFLAIFLGYLIIWKLLYVGINSAAIDFSDSSSSIARLLLFSLKQDAQLAALLGLVAFILDTCIRDKHTFKSIFFRFYTSLSLLVIGILYGTSLAYFSHTGQIINTGATKFLFWEDAFYIALESYYKEIILSSLLVMVFIFISFRLFQKSYFHTKPQSITLILTSKLLVFLFILLLIKGTFRDGVLSMNDIPKNTLKKNQLELLLNPLSYVMQLSILDRVLEDKYSANPLENLNIQTILEDKARISQFINQQAGSYSPDEIVQEPPSNVVIIILESFGAWYNHNKGFDSPTKNIQALAEKSIVFDNFYVTNNFTATSIFSLLFSIPDLTLIDAVNLQRESIYTPLSRLGARYDKAFIAASKLHMGKLKLFLAKHLNSQVIDLHDQTYFQEKQINRWGASDYTLFKYVIENLKATKSPFFRVVLTSSSHAPYTSYKDEFTDFAQSSMKIHGLEDYQTASINELDHSLGEFFRMAGQQAWYDDTLFVLMGDHTFSVKNANLAPREQALNQAHLLTKNPILMLYSPKAIKSNKHISEVVSVIDVMPIIMEILGFETDSSLHFGRKLSAIDATNSNALVRVSDHEVALVVNESEILVLDETSKKFEYRILSGSGSLNESELDAVKEYFLSLYNYSLYLLSPD